MIGKIVIVIIVIVLLLVLGVIHSVLSMKDFKARAELNEAIDKMMEEYRKSKKL